MKPTKDEVLAWAREATKAINADEEVLYTKVYVEKLAALAYAAGAAAVKERCAKVCETAEIPFDISVWHESTKKEMTAHTTNALASAIRAMED